ncbi:MAG: AAA family ATPase [Candidatus Omnitrophota bacterium]
MMISKVKVKHFKQFEDQEFILSDHIVLAGPNNSGKTSLLQAIVAWRLALTKWLMERGAGSKAKKRPGAPITRKDFTALPLRDMKLLWTNTAVSQKKDEGQPGYPRVIEIAIEGKEGAERWELAFEFRYQSSEQIYVKPSEKYIDNIPTPIQDFTIVHVPPFSGIGAEETRYDRPYQDLLIGQGKAGDILRNLLLEVYQQEDKSYWNELCQQIEEIFGYRLSPPEYEGRPYILCEYLKGVPRGKGKNGFPQLDIASAGSGFHQVLLLLAFFYARPATVFLLDEPDAHLHVILQKQIYDMLRSKARQRSCQLIIATHSEVLIDATSPEMILSFYQKPHILICEDERDQVRESLKRLTAADILRAELSPGILYVEGETDFNLLKAWANVLNHDLKDWFNSNPFWHDNKGCDPKEAKGHFFALRGVKPAMKGYLLLDGDNRRISDHDMGCVNLEIGRWTRYEAESYLLNPQVLIRFIESKGIPLLSSIAEDYLKEELPPIILREPLKDHDYFISTPVSKTILPQFFKKAEISISKADYYQIAEEMRPDEIVPEVKEKLDAIQEAFQYRKK